MKEGIQVDNEGNIDVEFVRPKDNKDLDIYSVNRDQSARKFSSYKVLYGFSKNKESKEDISSSSLTKISSVIKDFNNDKLTDKDKDNLRKAVILTCNFPFKITHLVTVESSNPLAKEITKWIAQKYSIKPENIFDLDKVEFESIDQAILWDKFKNADESSKKMVITYLKKYSQDGKFKIKKSAGLQSGVRDLLVNIYKKNKNIEKALDDQNPLSKWLVIDDVTFKGSTFKEAFSHINLPNTNLFGYVLLSNS